MASSSQEGKSPVQEEGVLPTESTGNFPTDTGDNTPGSVAERYVNAPPSGNTSHASQMTSYQGSSSRLSVAGNNPPSEKDLEQEGKPQTQDTSVAPNAYQAYWNSATSYGTAQSVSRSADQPRQEFLHLDPEWQEAERNSAMWQAAYMKQESSELQFQPDQMSQELIPSRTTKSTPRVEFAPIVQVMETTYQPDQDTMEDMQRSFPEESVTHMLQEHHQESMHSLRSSERPTEDTTPRDHALFHDQHSPINPVITENFAEGNQANVTTREKKAGQTKSFPWLRRKSKNKCHDDISLRSAGSMLASLFTSPLTILQRRKDPPKELNLPSDSFERSSTISLEGMIPNTGTKPTRQPRSSLLTGPETVDGSSP